MIGMGKGLNAGGSLSLLANRATAAAATAAAASEVLIQLAAAVRGEELREVGWMDVGRSQIRWWPRQKASSEVANRAATHFAILVQNHKSGDALHAILLAQLVFDVSGRERDGGPWHLIEIFAEARLVPV